MKLSNTVNTTELPRLLGHPLRSNTRSQRGLKPLRRALSRGRYHVYSQEEIVKFRVAAVQQRKPNAFLHFIASDHTWPAPIIDWTVKMIIGLFIWAGFLALLGIWAAYMDQNVYLGVTMGCGIGICLLTIYLVWKGYDAMVRHMNEHYNFTPTWKSGPWYPGPNESAPMAAKLLAEQLRKEVPGVWYVRHYLQCGNRKTDFILEIVSSGSKEQFFCFVW